MAKDIILEDFDLKIRNGDFVVDYSDQQHVDHLLISRQGEYRQSPFLGIGIQDQINAPMSEKQRQELEKKIKLHIESDGGSNVSVKVQDLESVNIEATYK